MAAGAPPHTPCLLPIHHHIPILCLFDYSIYTYTSGRHHAVVMRCEVTGSSRDAESLLKSVQTVTKRTI